MARLEATITETAHRSGPPSGELIDALESAQHENAALHETHADVGARLDRIIDRLRTVLER